MEIEVLFIDGIRIIYFDEDKIVIIVDEVLVKVDVRQYVLVMWICWNDKYFIGFVIDKILLGYKVLFDDGDQVWYKL